MVALGVSACGGAKTTTTTNAAGQTVVTCSIPFARTKFLIHAGIAAGAFYRYIYKPYRAGAFKKGAPGRGKALAKAAGSAVVVVHELRVAAQDARCDGPALKKLASPINGVVGAVGSLQSLATGGGLGALATAGGAFDRLRAAAAGAGATIK
jgi:hypothetical protein